jgi:tripartite-type tricarboxylate transporter receptor subunit TctC
MNDLLGGQLDYFCGNLGGYVPLVQAKQVKAIALLSRERSALMPELATAHEQGLTDLDVVTWTAFFLPKGAPKEVVDRLIAITHAAMDTPAIKDRMLQIGVTGVAPARRSPEYLAKFVADEIVRWEGPIKAAGLQVE